MLSELVVLGFLVVTLVYITVKTGRKWQRVRNLERSCQQVDPDPQTIEQESERKLKNESPHQHDKELEFNDPEEVG